MLDMDKRWFRRLGKHFNGINLWVFFAIAIIAGGISVFALRANNLKAMELRDKVIQTDKDNGDVEGALRELREHMYSHMNSDLTSGSNSIQHPIQLKYRYERLVQAEQERASTESEAVYKDAQAHCEELFPVGLSGSGRIPCITEYITSKGIEQKQIPDSLYKFNFVSPGWSPDLAGWSLLVAAVSFGLFVVRFGLERWVKQELHDL